MSYNLAKATVKPLDKAMLYKVFNLSRERMSLIFIALGER